MKSATWKNLSKNYKGLWVALKKDEETVVSSGKNAKKVYEEAQKKGVKLPILYKVPVTSGFYVGRFS